MNKRLVYVSMSFGLLVLSGENAFSQAVANQPSLGQEQHVGETQACEDNFLNSIGRFFIGRRNPCEPKFACENANAEQIDRAFVDLATEDGLTLTIASGGDRPDHKVAVEIGQDNGWFRTVAFRKISDCVVRLKQKMNYEVVIDPSAHLKVKKISVHRSGRKMDTGAEYGIYSVKYELDNELLDSISCKYDSYDMGDYDVAELLHEMTAGNLSLHIPDSIMKTRFKSAQECTLIVHSDASAKVRSLGSSAKAQVSVSSSETKRSGIENSKLNDVVRIGNQKSQRAD